MDRFLKISVLILLFSLEGIFIYFYRTTGEAIYHEAFRLFFYIIFFVIFLFLLPHIYRTFKKINEKQKSRKHLEFLSSERSYGNLSDSFFENSPIALAICNGDLEILSSNKVFQKLIEKNFSKKIKYLSDMFEVKREDFAEIISPASVQNSYESFDTNLNTVDKKPFTIFGVPYSGSSKKILLQFIDNSEKSELKEKFIQAQKMQAIGQLAGGVAHDFNNLLTAIIGFCDLLLARHSPGDQSFVDLVQIKQNANRAANLVKQLLAFSRKQTMQMTVINITEVLAEVSNLLRRLIGENISLVLNNARDVWDIRADKSQLEQVFINLAVNSRDAMSQGGTLNIVTENKEIFSVRDLKFKYENFSGPEEINPGKYLAISFEDSGCGISKDNLKKVFEPFFTTKGVGQGTGLGLATVTGIIEQTGGYMFVSSKENEGTEFQILFKRYERPKYELEAKEVQPVKQKDLTGTGVILIVEDEDPVRAFSSRALKNKGYVVHEAISGENALEMIEEIGGDKIDLIISDVVMPGISGPEMVEKVVEKYPSIRVIFVSGYGEDAFYQKYGLERKFNFLPKPYTLNQIAEKVKEQLAS